MTYDLIIIGAGPAGLTASIYASRYKINHLVIGELPGGLITGAHSVCNFPGENRIPGFDLSEKFRKHVEDLGGEIKSFAKVVNLKKNNNIFELSLDAGEKLEAKTILLATGTKPRKLNLAEEDKYLGKGLAYCATCDGAFFKDKTVGVVGGGNSAMTSALYLADLAKKVYLIVRDENLVGERVWEEQINKNPKIEVLFKSQLQSLKGDNSLSGVLVLNSENLEQELGLEGLFVEIGSDPDNSLAEQLGVEIEGKYLKVNSAQKTNIEGLWAAGDNTTGSNFFRQVITACSEGAVAVDSIFTYLQQNK